MSSNSAPVSRDYFVLTEWRHLNLSYNAHHIKSRFYDLLHLHLFYSSIVSPSPKKRFSRYQYFFYRKINRVSMHEISFFFHVKFSIRKCWYRKNSCSKDSTMCTNPEKWKLHPHWKRAKSIGQFSINYILERFWN